MRSLLLVEDDDTTREVLTLLLEDAGWKVTGVGDGEAAVGALRGSGPVPDAALCDLNLPGLEGSELAAQLRDTAPAMPVVAMSASALDATPAGYDALLLKPFGAAELDEALRGLRTEVHDRKGAVEEDAEGLPILHPETVLNLERQMGTRAKGLYAFALADAQDRLRHMEQAAGRADQEAFRREAHSLKGSAGMIGAQRLAKLAAEAENFALGRADVPAEATLQKMHLACSEIRLMLETLFPV